MFHHYNRKSVSFTFSQAPLVDVVVVPISGGGLITAVAVAIKALSPTAIIVRLVHLHHDAGVPHNAVALSHSAGWGLNQAEPTTARCRNKPAR
jgi:methyl coenzyme M reductase subunit C